MNILNRWDLALVTWLLKLTFFIGHLLKTWVMEQNSVVQSKSMYEHLEGKWEGATLLPCQIEPN